MNQRSDIICCIDCGKPMRYIYHEKLRKFCHECLQEMSIKNAKEILDPRKRK